MCLPENQKMVLQSLLSPSPTAYQVHSEMVSLECLLPRKKSGDHGACPKVIWWCSRISGIPGSPPGCHNQFMEEAIQGRTRAIRRNSKGVVRGQTSKGYPSQV